MKKIINKLIKENKVVFYSFLSIVPLLLYGFYKNIILNKDISYFELFIGIIATIIFLLGFILYKKKSKKKVTIYDFYIISTILFLPLKFNIFIIFIIYIILFILSKSKIKIPYQCIIVLFMIISSYIIYKDGTFSFNLLSSEYDYSILNLFFGKSDSYFFTSNFFLAIISFIILCNTGNYKKFIPIIFIILYIPFILIFGSFIDYTFLNVSGIFLAVMYIATNYTFSPITKKGMLIYTSLIFILTIIFNILFDYYIGIILSILLVQIMYKYVVQKVFTK